MNQSGDLAELESMMRDLESDLVERKESLRGAPRRGFAKRPATARSKMPSRTSRKSRRRDLTAHESRRSPSDWLAS